MLANTHTHTLSLLSVRLSRKEKKNSTIESKVLHRKLVPLAFNASSSPLRGSEPADASPLASIISVYYRVKARGCKGVPGSIISSLRSPATDERVRVARSERGPLIRRGKWKEGLVGSGGGRGGMEGRGTCGTGMVQGPGRKEGRKRGGCDYGIFGGWCGFKGGGDKGKDSGLVLVGFGTVMGMRVRIMNTRVMKK